MAGEDTLPRQYAGGEAPATELVVPWMGAKEGAGAEAGNEVMMGKVVGLEPRIICSFRLAGCGEHYFNLIIAAAHCGSNE